MKAVEVQGLGRDLDCVIAVPVGVLEGERAGWGSWRVGYIENKRGQELNSGVMKWDNDVVFHEHRL